MGITNFTLLLDCFDKDEDQFNESFDSILIDVQSIIYVAIDQAFTSVSNEKGFFYEISTFVQSQIAKTMISIFDQMSFEDENEIVVVCSFDGEGVPMKWPTQKIRRQKADVSGKNLFRVALFGNNSISTHIQKHFIQCLRNKSFHENHFKYRTTKKNKMPRNIRYIISGCDVEGEGEHKIFHIAEQLSLRRPVVASIDNDAFVLSFMRVDKKPFLSLQLYRKNKIYNCSHFAKYILPFPIKMLIYASFLFGNDFIPPILPITRNNYGVIHTMLLMIFEKGIVEEISLPTVIFHFLQKMEGCMKFQITPSLDRDQIIQFWTTCLWVMDYYEKRSFPQKYMKNKLFDNFDRNAVLTGLMDEEIAIDTYNEAKELYYNHYCEKEQSDPLSSSVEQIFDEDTLKHVSKYLLPMISNTASDDDDERRKGGFCHDIKISTLKRK